MRYLVKRHGIELHQLRAISVGKVALGAGEKASPDPRSRLCPFRRNSCSRRKQQGSMRRPGGDAGVPEDHHAKGSRR